MKISIIDIFKRLIKFDKALGVTTNGIDNLYSERSERFILNSVTAKMSSAVMASYLAGKGFGNDDSLVVGTDGLTLKKLGQTIAKNFSKNRGAWIHVNYNGNFEPSGYSILPYADCRLGKKDDDDYNGKIVVFDGWEKANKKTLKEKARVIDVYNPNKKIVEAQINNAKGLSKYKGQVWYVNLDEEYFYALSQIDAVMNDCDSEAQASVFKNRSLRKGFFGKTVIITKPLAGNIEDYDSSELHRRALSERDDFKDTIYSFIGAENTGGALVVEIDHDGTDLVQAIKFENIKSDIDDKLFAHTETSVFQNILVAFNNIPAGLVRSEGSIFASSGEALRIMKETYQENTNLERSVLEETVNELTKRLAGFNKEVNLIPLIEVTDTSIEGLSEDELIQKKAQAALKGSVGGVQALLAIQAGVTSGTTDRNAALTIIEELFGVSRELANAMLGEPKKEEEG